MTGPTRVGCGLLERGVAYVKGAIVGLKRAMEACRWDSVSLKGVMAKKWVGGAHQGMVVADWEEVWLPLKGPQLYQRWCDPPQ